MPEYLVMPFQHLVFSRNYLFLLSRQFFLPCHLEIDSIWLGVFFGKWWHIMELSLENDSISWVLVGKLENASQIVELYLDKVACMLMKCLRLPVWSGGCYKILPIFGSCRSWCGCCMLFASSCCKPNCSANFISILLLEAVSIMLQ